MSAAVKQEQVFDVKTNGDIHWSVEPQTPEPGTILDEHGQQLAEPSKDSMMVRLDSKAKEAITVSRGTLWFIGTAIAIVPIIVILIGYVITIAMGYQGNLSRVTELDSRVAKLEAAVTKIQSLEIGMNNIEKDVSSVKKSHEAAEQDRKDILKNMGDIRILLAQKQMGAQ